MARPRAPRGKQKNKQTDPSGGDKKKKKLKLRMNIRNVLVRFETQTFLE